MAGADDAAGDDTVSTDLAVPVEATLEPVIDAEVVAQPAPSRRLKVYDLYVHHPRVPLALKPASRVPEAIPARRELAIRAAKAPTITTARSVARGTVVVARAWHRWVQVSDYREAAMTDGKYADKAKDIRETSRLRWKATLILAVVVAITLTLVALLASALILWMSLLILGSVLAVAGRRKDGSPGRKPSLPTARRFGWTMDPDVLNTNFREARVIGKDETLRLVKHAHFDGKGWLIVVDLPGTRKASDAVKSLEAVASSMALDEICLVLERVRGDDGHAGRLSLWAAPKDPFGGELKPFPLIKAESWNAWRAIPFGTDARDREILLGLIESNLLTGSIPGMGKTVACRVAVSGFVLDPHVQIYCWDGKGSKDWRAIEEVAYRFGKGDSDEEAVRLRDTLAELKAEIERRYARMADLDDERCPDSKLTPELSRDRSLRMPLTVFIVDELQAYTSNSEEGFRVRGKKASVGENIGFLLEQIAKKSRAVGVILILATQRPDGNSLPVGLREVIGTRFALKTKSGVTSNMILGQGMKDDGYDSSRLLATHRGVGILAPDGESDAARFGNPTLRTYYLTSAQWTAICQRGRDLRMGAGTLRGHAAGEEASFSQEAVSRAAREAEHAPPEVVDAEVIVPLPPLLEAILAYVADDDRDRVPSMELLEEVLPNVAGCEQWTETRLGLQLRKWGARTGRTGRGGRSGPAISDLFAARDRIEDGGPAEVVTGVDEAI